MTIIAFIPFLFAIIFAILYIMLNGATKSTFAELSKLGWLAAILVTLLGAGTVAKSCGVDGNDAVVREHR